MEDNGVRDGSEKESLDRAIPVRPEDNQVGAPMLGCFDNDFLWGAFQGLDSYF